MAINDPTRTYDGWDSLIGGMDGGRSPTLIDKTQCAQAENIAFRDGRPTTRPGWKDSTHHFHNTLYYDEDGVLSDEGVDSETCFNTHVFQSALYYASAGQPECIMAMIGGRLFKIDPTPIHSHLDITEVALPRHNNPTNGIVYMVQADRFHITQDGESAAIIYDGVMARRALPNEVITGTIMAYGMGRLIVVRGQDIYFGDLYGSHPGDPGDSVLKFTETTFLNEGGPAAISLTMGKIKGLVFAPQQDSSTGDGELLAMAEKGVVSFFVSLPRDQWKESAFQRITLLNVGARGHRAIVSINGDVWFRANDGWRSYRQARAEQHGWAHLPMSTEVRLYLNADTPFLLDYASAINFDNRLIGTCTPRPNSGRVFHNGLTALDFQVLSSFEGATKPAWDGHWTKLKITQLVSGIFHNDNRAFAFAINDDGENHLYELSKLSRRDFDGPITSELTGRSMTFSQGGSDMPFNEKELYGADIWIDDSTEEVAFTLEYRPDQHPDWFSWWTSDTIEAVGTCQAITCGGVPTIRKNFLPRKRIGKPGDQCDSEFTNRLRRLGFEFQPRIRWTGHARIHRFRLHAKMITEKSSGSC